MIWHEHLNAGFQESGAYTIRRVTQGYEVWYRHGQYFKCLSRPTTLVAAKNAAEIHRKDPK